MKFLHHPSVNLLGGHSRTPIPGEIASIVLDSLGLYTLISIQEPAQTVLFAVLNCFFLRIELQLHVGQWISPKNYKLVNLHQPLK